MGGGSGEGARCRLFFIREKGFFGAAVGCGGAGGSISTGVRSGGAAERWRGMGGGWAREGREDDSGRTLDFFAARDSADSECCLGDD